MTTETTKTDQNYDYAINRGFHQKTAFEMADEIKRMIAQQPQVKFEELEVGQVVYYDSGSYSRHQVLRVLKTTPARKLADVAAIDGKYKFRAARGKYYGSFSVLNAELVSFVGLTHEAIIKEAMCRDLEIPARVRIHYAEIFVTQPERFRAGRLNEFITPQWGRAVTAKAIDEAIKDTHQRIQQLQEGRTKSLAINPPHSKDYDEFIEKAISDLDFYRWVRPLVEQGGVFYLNGDRP